MTVHLEALRIFPYGALHLLVAMVKVPVETLVY